MTVPAPFRRTPFLLSGEECGAARSGQGRALFGAAKRTLEGEDRSARIPREGMATDVRRSCKSSLQWFARYLPEHATRRGAKFSYTAQVQCGTAGWRTFGLLQAGRLFIMHGRNVDGRNVDGRNVDGRNVDGRNVDGRNVDTLLTVARESSFSRTLELAANTRPFSLRIHCEEGTVTTNGFVKRRVEFRGCRLNNDLWCRLASVMATQRN